MTDPIRAELSLSIANRVYTLRFNARFIRLIEEMFPGPDGLPRRVDAIFNGTGVPLSYFTRAIWAALQSDKDDRQRFPTVEALEDELGDLSRLKELSEVVGRGINRALGKEWSPRPPEAAAPAE